MPPKRVPDPASTTAERRAIAEEQSRQLSEALERVGSPLRTSVFEHTMTSMDGDELATGTFAIAVEDGGHSVTVGDPDLAVGALSRLGPDAPAERVAAALHGPYSRFARLRVRWR